MNVTSLLADEVLGFVIALAVVVALKMLTREMNLNGLLARKQGGGQVSSERVQLLVATLAVSARYIGAVVHSSGGKMPDVGTASLYVFGTSGGIYAMVKAFTTLRMRARGRSVL